MTRRFFCSSVFGFAAVPRAGEQILSNLAIRGRRSTFSAKGHISLDKRMVGAVISVHDRFSCFPSRLAVSPFSALAQEGGQGTGRVTPATKPDAGIPCCAPAYDWHAELSPAAFFIADQEMVIPVCALRQSFSSGEALSPPREGDRTCAFSAWGRIRSLRSGFPSRICCRLARHSGAMVLSLDYRLAPEAPFPAAVEDSWAALLWLNDQARKSGLSLAVCGDSAGGNLAAVLALRARDRGLAALVGQMLYYPAVSGLWSPSSREVFAEGYMLTARLLDWYGRQYVRDDREMLDPDFAPVFARDLAALAPAMIVTAGFDPLRGEGELYTRLLREAGVSVRLICFPRAIHGFLNFYAALVDGRRALRLGGRFLRDCLAAGSKRRHSTQA